jgi:hypothetical protein
MSAFTATKGERWRLTNLFVGSNVIKASLVKPWRVCFPRIRTGIDKKKVEEMVNITIEKSLRKNLQVSSDDESDGEENDERTKLPSSLLGKVKSSEDSRFKSMIEYGHSMTVLSMSDSFIDFVIDTVNYFVYIKKRVIIITMRTELTDRLYEALHLDSEDGTRFIVDYLDRDRRECGNCDILIGTHKMLGTGFDEKNAIRGFEGDAASVLLFLGSIKNETLMYQIAGRAFRSNDPLVIFPHMTDIPVSSRHIDMVNELIASEFPECSVCDASSEIIQRAHEAGKRERLEATGAR